MSGLDSDYSSRPVFPSAVKAEKIRSFVNQINTSVKLVKQKMTSLKNWGVGTTCGGGNQKSSAIFTVKF